MILMNPGPVTLSERVRRSLLQTDLCHREVEYFDLQDEARTRLLGVYGLDPAEWTAVLMTGSGTAAVDSMMASVPPADARVLVVENGVYGERISQMCAQYLIAHEALHGEWLQAPDLPRIAQRLAGGGFTHLAVVHHETTTGRLNDLGALGRLCREHGASLLVDAVSSFGAEAIDFSDDALAAVAATANKCLHGVPGMSFVLVRRSALTRAASRTYYLDLVRLAQAQDRRNTPFTPAIHACYALVECLREFAETGGRVARFAHYAGLAEQARAGLAALGIEALLPPGESSVVLRSYRLPAGLSYQALHDALKAAGFVIYAGQGDLSKSLFRISTMGAMGSTDIERFLSCIAGLLRAPRAAS